jgi:acylphosphatase
MATKALHARVTGRVQGVGFRVTTARVGRELGVTGWVRNDSDGSVEVWAQGDVEAVDRFVRFLRVGPTGARVDAVVTSPGVANGSLVGFDVRH